ncbi:type VII secretion protein EccB [Klugiella xanthotipulae]|uniref:Type VII secretion protein EccB n=1 Tax=Klugiella xanthotipulae TaxID=244735 RepID=A0A543HH04_9MICO|nr:type VII secretion protein EccB [Klugiella xanthotipulae]TQM57614.1 type VII secretion protein EccB [Klugiella xanthotipulae]
MATKKELIQAQGYSRRRLLTAFVSGAPGGKELEPAKPLRAVVAGIALSVLVLVVSAIIGFIKPGLPDGWENNSLLIVKDSGARYVTKDGTLYPVINTTSAQLVIPADSYNIITVTADTIATVPRGGVIGILGAPDSLPTADDLITSRWASCIVEDGSQFTMLTPRKAVTQPTSDAVLARQDDNLYLVVGGYRYLISTTDTSGVRRAIGMDQVTPITVDARWLNLFSAGATISTLTIPDAGKAPPTPVTVDSTSLRVGTILHPQGLAEDKRYILTATGELARLTPLAYQLYLIGAGAGADEIDVPPAVIKNLNTAAAEAAPENWPDDIVTPARSDAAATCATVAPSSGKGPSVELSILADESPLSGIENEITVPPARGALVRAIGAGAPNAGSLYLIDSSGVAFPIPHATDDILKQLNYTSDDVRNVPQSWLTIFPIGPSLTEAAASSAPAETSETED